MTYAVNITMAVYRRAGLADRPIYVAAQGRGFRGAVPFADAQEYLDHIDVHGVPVGLADSWCVPTVGDTIELNITDFDHSSAALVQSPALPIILSLYGAVGLPRTLWEPCLLGLNRVIQNASWSNWTPPGAAPV